MYIAYFRQDWSAILIKLALTFSASHLDQDFPQLLASFKHGREVVRVVS
jgi:hypothetical protein